MHMADALISPVVGGTMWVATIGVAAYSIKKVKNDIDEKKVPLMGVMGAFVFAAQMINFSIPGTGSSGHLGGGLLLAILLGPYAGFLTMASILTIQCLFFADGGLLALGCNIFNLGFYTCFLAYPLIYKRITNKGYSKKRIFSAAMISAIIGLQLGAFSVVIETLLSGKTELPFSSFVLLMQPIHLAIGVVEGIVVTSIVSFVWKMRPELIENTNLGQPIGNISIKKVIISFAIMTLVVGGVLSWFASANPDGLEWAMFKSSGKEELQATTSIHKTMEEIQDKTAILPDYNFKATEAVNAESTDVNVSEEAWPSVSAGTSISGFVGGILTLILASIIGFMLSIFKKKTKVERVK
ncbi:energy-coupling factor ABC transporter permease [Clostridium uliginosum]|uniref:Cobalt/nickel transport system permease protein n=1 Tax=Clostridium uliginosum TaxID=119641 RepID=A0A1I1JNT5_9CLOT|nr:energy-coupling factor ABC transporter permease [Clostridium uliginosum]SFC50277.1 cobalt/nickel transport system permease protein [Clostridium uliginosum]